MDPADERKRMQIWPGKEACFLPKLGMGVLDFHKDERATMEKFRQEIRLAIEKDRAEVIILGCSMQFGFTRNFSR